MAKYTYKAKSGPASVVEGMLEGDSSAAVAQKLNRLGYFPISIQVEKGGSKSISFLRRSKKIPIAEMSATFRQLSDLMNAGLPLTSVLSMVTDQSSHATLKEILKKLTMQVREGQSLSQAMEAYPAYFRPFHTKLIYSGETSGTLESILARLADIMEKEDEIRAQIKSALAYPLFIVMVGALTILFLLTFVVPRLAMMFTEFQQSLPLPTKILLQISTLMSRYAWAGILVIPLLYVTLIQEKNRSKIKSLIDSLSLKLPLFRAWVLKKEIGSFSRTLGSLLKNGVPILQALSVSADTIQNTQFKRLVLPIETKVREGTALSRCLREIPAFSAYVCNLVAVGEEGGRLDDSLLKIAESYERQSQRDLKTLVSLLEPFLILVIGTVLGLIVISIMLPIFEINALIH